MSMNAEPMTVDCATGLLVGAAWHASAHCDDRPPGQVIDLLVLHGISLPAGEFGGPWIDQLFTGALDCEAHPSFAELAGLRVSAHLLIRRDGSVIQYVPLHRRAWHAGESSFEGRTACNDFSIGIELEGTDTLPYDAAQYQVLTRILPAVLTAYPHITRSRIVAHSAIAPGRKTDPGPAFDWSRLQSLLANM